VPVVVAPVVVDPVVVAPVVVPVVVPLLSLFVKVVVNEGIV
jgi:hypothetical protein